MPLGSVSDAARRSVRAVLALAAAVLPAQAANAARVEFTFGGTVLFAAPSVPGAEPPPAFASVQVGDTYSLSVVFDEVAPDQCALASCSVDPQANGIYALDSMTVSINDETYTWTDGTQMRVVDDQIVPPPPYDGPPPAPPPPPPEVYDQFYLASDRSYVAFPSGTDLIHASLALSDFAGTHDQLDSDAIPFALDPGNPPWSGSQINMFAHDEAVTLTTWGLAGNVTSFSRRTVPEPSAFSSLLLAMGAGLFARVARRASVPEIR